MLDSYHIVIENGFSTVSLSGSEPTAAETETLFSNLKKKIDWKNSSDVILDLADLSGGSDALVTSIVGLAVHAQSVGGDLVVAHASERLFGIAGVMGMERYLRFYDSADQAILEFRMPQIYGP